jgi:hypothetical protein
LGVTVKLNEIFPGFGLQELAPPQQQESEIEAFNPKESKLEEDTIAVFPIAPTQPVRVFNENEMNAILSQHLTPIISVVAPVDVSRLNLEAMASNSLVDFDRVGIFKNSSPATSFKVVSATENQLLYWYFSPQLAIDWQSEQYSSKFKVRLEGEMPR